MGLGVLTGVKAWINGIGEKRGLLAATVGVYEFSEEEISFSQPLDVCTADSVCRNFEIISETGGAEGKLLLSDDSGDESKITSVSEQKY